PAYAVRATADSLRVNASEGWRPQRDSLQRRREPTPTEDVWGKPDSEWNLASPIYASWNQIAGWLKGIGALRRVA
ncbi:MAG: hypothetical protein ABL961_16150, partial [Vicinamibacterales bacterium]